MPRYRNWARVQVKTPTTTRTVLVLTTRPRVTPAATRKADMDIDMTTLRMLERERDISLDVLVSAIEQALLSAYHRTPGAQQNGPASRWTARPATSPCGRRDPPTVDPRTGVAPSDPGPEFDDTPRGLRPHRDRDRAPGHRRSGCATPRTTRCWGRSAARRARSSAASSSRAATRASSWWTSAAPRPCSPPHEQVPTEEYVHGERLRAYVLEVAPRAEGPADHAVAARTRTSCASSSSSRSPRSPTAPWRSPRSPARRATAPRWPSARRCPGRQRQGRLHRPDGRARAGGHGRAARREDRHRRPRRRPGRDRSRTRCRPPGCCP